MPPEPTPPLPPRSNQSYPEKRTYVPPSVERAMARQLERAAGTESPDPGQTVQPQTLFQPDSAAPPEAPSVPPPAGQPTTGQPTAAAPGTPPVAPPTPNAPYDFITASPQPAQKFGLTSLPGGSSKVGRTLLVVGGLVVLVIIIAIVKSVLFGSNFNATPFVTVGQDQQELLHLVADASQTQNANLSTTSQNFVATAQASLSTSQTALFTYLTDNHYKLDPKVLDLRISTTLDSQLTTATADDTYDQTFQQIMNNALNTYLGDLSQAYNHTTGVHGHALLQSAYRQAELLHTQLNTPTV